MEGKISNMSRIFLGELVDLYIQRNDGHSIGTLIQGIKDGMPIPQGNHIHGGNGTFVDYSHPQYIKKDHKIAAIFMVEVIYKDEWGKHITEKQRKTVVLGDFPDDIKYSDKQDMILSFCTSWVNEHYKHQYNTQENHMFELCKQEIYEGYKCKKIWKLRNQDDAEFLQYIVPEYYKLMRVQLNNFTKETFSKNRDSIEKSLIKEYDILNLYQATMGCYDDYKNGDAGQ